MANFTLLDGSESARGSLTGVNVDPMLYMDWNLKTNAVTSTAAAASVLYTPVIDMNAVAPKCNRVVIHKLLNVASADTVTVQVSPDGTNWYTAPIYNGGTGSGLATLATSLAELTIAALPSMRYVRGVITIATAMTTLTTARLALSFMRF